MDQGFKSCFCVFFVLQRKNVYLLLNVFLLAACGAVLLACRFYWMGNKPPNFSNSDNPAADSPSLLTRTLTFSYLPAINFWLLLCPDTLSFDWSMDALPLIRSLTDWRNFYTLLFYLGLLLLAWFSLWMHQTSKGKETNGKAHHYTNGRNGHSNGHSYQYNNHEHMNNYHTDVHINSAQNGTKKHYESRTPLPTTENVVVFSLGLLAIPFLPATNLFFYVGFVIAERVLYIPSMGFCLLVAVGMRSLYVRLRRRSSRAMLVYCSAAVVLLFGVKTILRNRDWQNEEMLYKSGIYVNPAKGEAPFIQISMHTGATALTCAQTHFLCTFIHIPKPLSPIIFRFLNSERALRHGFEFDNVCCLCTAALNNSKSSWFRMSSPRHSALTQKIQVLTSQCPKSKMSSTTQG